MAASKHYRLQVVGYYCEVLGLTVWIGGLFMIIAAVIPAVFNSFGMEPSGRFLRRLFDGYSQITLGILVFLAISLSLRLFYGYQSSVVMFPVTRIEGILIGTMFVVTILIVWIFGPQAIALQEQVFDATSELEKTQAYDRFFRLHMIVRALHLCNVGLATGLLILKLKQGISWHQPAHG